MCRRGQIDFVIKGNFDFVLLERGAQAKISVGLKDARCLLANIFMQQMYLFIMLTSYYSRLKLHLPIKNGKKKLTRVSFYLACRPHSLCCAERLQDAKRWHMQFRFANFKVALLTNYRPEIN